MDKIKAKSVIDDEYWILHEDNKKVGQVIQIPAGKFEVSIKGHKTTFDNLESLKRSPIFTFIDLPSVTAAANNNVEGYQSEGEAFNAVWDVRYNLPLYTQSEESKSWMAAGYYKVSVHGIWIVQYCPKLITLQRNEYKGPFKHNPGINQFKQMFE